jgi:hypothetical protein
MTTRGKRHAGPSVSVYRWTSRATPCYLLGASGSTGRVRPSRIATLRARLAVRDPDTNPVDKMPWVAISPCPPLARKLPVLVRNALKTVWVCCGIPSPKQVYWLDDRRRLLVEIKSSEIVARAGRRRRRSLLDPLNP